MIQATIDQFKTLQWSHWCVLVHSEYKKRVPSLVLPIVVNCNYKNVSTEWHCDCMAFQQQCLGSAVLNYIAHIMPIWRRRIGHEIARCNGSHLIPVSGSKLKGYQQTTLVAGINKTLYCDSKHTWPCFSPFSSTLGLVKPPIFDFTVTMISAVLCAISMDPYISNCAMLFIISFPRIPTGPWRYWMWYFHIMQAWSICVDW